MAAIHVKTVVRERGTYHVATLNGVPWCVGVGPTKEWAIGDLICRNSERAGIALTRDPAEPCCGQCGLFEPSQSVKTEDGTAIGGPITRKAVTS